MVDILELPEVRRMVSPISIEQYHLLPEYAPSGKRTELIRGIIIEKMSKSPLHVALLRRLLRLVEAAVEAGLLVYKEDPLTFLDSEPEPDISVVEGKEGDYNETLPTTARLVIEVAVTTVKLDRAKAPLYAEASIPEYWLVLAKEKTVEVYTEPRDGKYTQHHTYSSVASVVSTVLPALRVELGELFRD